jgi:hypothetical protein
MTVERLLGLQPEILALRDEVLPAAKFYGSLSGTDFPILVYEKHGLTVDDLAEDLADGKEKFVIDLEPARGWGWIARKSTGKHNANIHPTRSKVTNIGKKRYDLANKINEILATKHQSLAKERARGFLGSPYGYYSIRGGLHV